MRVVSNGRNRSRRTYSIICDQTFHSAVEARRADWLRLLEIEGKIRDLETQPVYVLCENPRITYAADFRFVLVKTGQTCIEDVKGGAITRELRVKLAWLHSLGVDVDLVTETGYGWHAERITDKRKRKGDATNARIEDSGQLRTLRELQKLRCRQGGGRPL